MSTSQATRLGPQRQTVNLDSKRIDKKTFVGWAIFVMFLAWLFAPVVKQNREWDKRLRSEQRMEDIVRAQLLFEEENGRLPNNQNGLSWRVHLLPYLGEHQLHKKFVLSEPWDSPNNIKLVDQMPDIYKSEGLVKKLARGKTVFLRPVGNGAFPLPESVEDESFSINSIMKELAQTVFLVEANPDQAVNWSQPKDYEFDPMQPKKNLGNARTGSTILCKGNAAIWHVTYIYDAIDLKERFTIMPQTPVLLFDSKD